MSQISSIVEKQNIKIHELIWSQIASKTAVIEKIHDTDRIAIYLWPKMLKKEGHYFTD